MGLPGLHIDRDHRPLTFLGQPIADPVASDGCPAVNQCHAWIVCPGVGTFVLWCILLVFCWPLALLAVVAYPVVWILLIPFRLVGIAVDGLLGLLRGMAQLPARLLRGPRAF
jgi:hypothetical protein